MTTAPAIARSEAYDSFDEVKKVIEAFEGRTLPRAQWTHAAHLTVAFWYLVCYPLPEATVRIKAGILRYNESQGVRQTKEGGYHETITLFWIRVVRHFLTTATLEVHLVALLNELISRCGASLPLEYYSRAHLFSWEARLQWAEPDLKPLP
jgi:hypothetical protein